jgi:UDP-GlcNAc3NAcA epimerase
MADRLRFVSIVGARPQFIKAAVLSRAIRARHEEVIVHTGQHYDPEMSAIFFEEMAIPPPTIQLDSGGGSHAQQTAAMLVGIEDVLVRQRPDWVVTFGDTNSTLAGALAAVKLQIPIAHVEAGLRSFNLAMPEEINRILVDRISTALLCPSQTAVSNLAGEGICAGVHLVGDVMAQALAMATPLARARSHILADLGLAERSYILVTVHRAGNTDAVSRLRSIIAALDSLDEQVVFPVHPRTRKALDALGYVPAGNVRLTPPLGYLDMDRLITAARLIMTDSGGLQKEAYWAGVPCVTLRDETEWVETVEHGWNVLVGADSLSIVNAARTFEPPSDRPALYGTTGVAEACVDLLEGLPQAACGAERS